MDLTLRELLRQSRRYLPYLISVLGVAVLALMAPGTTTAGTDLAGRGGGAVEAADGRSRVGGAADEPAASDAPGELDSRADVARTTAGQAARTALAIPGGTARPRGQTAAIEPRSSTAAATDAPDCDTAVGRLKMPTASGIYPPNCVSLWDRSARNGGTTWTGVTGDTITVAIYVAQDNAAAGAITAGAGVSDDTDEAEDDANRTRVIEAFQAHYETYGRTVRWVKIRGSGPSDDDAAARADAIKVATELKAFASIGDPSQAAGATAGGTNVYIDELAARGVMCIACTQTQPQRNFEKWAPYAWGQRISADQLYLHVAEYIGKGLGNDPAKWAGDPLMQTRPRRYGLLQYNTPDNSYAGAAQFLDDALATYGLRLTTTSEYMLDLPRGQEIARTVMAKMKDSGITSVICYCDPLMPVFFTQEATRQQYFPEWLVTGSLATDTALFGRLYDQAQWAHAHGVSLLPARVDPDALASETSLVTWHHGESLSSTPNLFSFGMLYTGIHLAGPQLTPTTFRDGMFSFKAASGYITRVATAYGTGRTPWPDYHALDDTTDIWWDADTTGKDEIGADGPGMYRYVDRGKRYLLSERPQRPSRAFDPADTTLIYDRRPESDATPSYPHEHHRGT